MLTDLSTWGDEVARALKERDMDQIEALKASLSAVPDDSDPSNRYQLMIKKRQMSSFLRKAMRDAGYDELSKMTRFKKVTEE